MKILKAVVLGDTECGKTSFTQRYTTGNFPDPNFLRTTIGASFDTKKIVTPSGLDVTLSIWDFGGQLRFIDQMKSMIRGATVGLLFFDVTRLQTLDSLEGYWIPAIEDNSKLKLLEGDGPRFMIVANKVDMLEEDRYDFIQDEMRYVMQKYDMGGQMISARTGIGIDRLDEGFMAVVDHFTSE